MRPLFAKQVRWQDVPDLRILFSGDRNWSNRILVQLHLIEILRLRIPLYDLTVIEGEADGLDTMAREEAEKLSCKVLRFPADWDKYGRGAGPIRNKQMLVEGKPHFVMAYHPDIANSAGTANMISQTQKAGLPWVLFNDLGAPSCDWLNLKVVI